MAPQERFDLAILGSGSTAFAAARPAGLWWVIADFQPDPVHDPTLSLEPGRVLVVPSIRTVQEEIFSETRRAEATP
jgi:hypothetical protein